MMKETVQRNTAQKQAILHALCALGHPSAQEVYEYVRRENPKISRGTVFRVLGSYAESGRIRKLNLADSDARFDATMSPHQHARCRLCGRVFDVFLEGDLLSGVEIEGFTAESYSVEIYGICQNCQEKGEETCN